MLHAPPAAAGPIPPPQSDPPPPKRLPTASQRHARARWLLPAAIGALLALSTSLGNVRAAEPVRIFRISTENGAGHVQTRVVRRFARALEAKSGGRLKVEYRPGAVLFRDRDVFAALSQGQVEMAVPGTWQLDRFDPYVGVLMLPMFVGRDAEQHHRVRDGRVGRLISERLEDVLDVKVLGRWIDLGFAHLYFSAHDVAAQRQLAGLRIRTPGGEANAARLSALGAEPLPIAWPDLPEVLEQDRVDGLLSTHETVASGRLWSQGIRYALETREYFAQYVPIVAGDFWRRLPPDLQQILLTCWQDIVDDARHEAARAQQRARRTLVAHGVRVRTLDEPQRDAWRRTAASGQAALAARLGVPAHLVESARRALEDEQ